MVALQRNINFDDIGVIVVSDGYESELPDELFAGYPYDITNLTIDHRGVSGARNAGIDASDAEWVMICDWDDTFASLNALHILLSAAQDETKVMYWSHFIEEIMVPEKGIIYHSHDRDYIFNHGKMFRKDWLDKEHLRYHPKLTLHEDVYFNTMTQAVAKEEEIGEIKSGFYLWCWNPNSVSRKVDNWLIRTYDHMIRQRLAISQELNDRGLDDALEMTVVKTLIDGYYDFQQKAWYEAEVSKDYRNAERWYCTYMKAWWHIYKDTDPVKIAAMARVARDYRVQQGFLLMENQTLRDFLLHMNNDVKPFQPSEWNL